jgi:hypothetical protein
MAYLYAACRGSVAYGFGSSPARALKDAREQFPSDYNRPPEEWTFCPITLTQAKTIAEKGSCVIPCLSSYEN